MGSAVEVSGSTVLFKARKVAIENDAKTIIELAREGMNLSEQASTTNEDGSGS
jgi:hypothetical protein